MAIRESAESIVYIVDDDQAVRHAMALLMRSVGLPHRVFHSGTEFLDGLPDIPAGCLVLDIRMPGIGGMELQETLVDLDVDLPIIFVTGYADVPMAVAAMQKGAFDFIEKPFRDQELLDRIHAALNMDRERREQTEAAERVHERLGRLTGREIEVMNLVVAGKPNKLIAHELGVSQRTVEIHRARVMEKTEAGSLAELVRLHLAATA